MQVIPSNPKAAPPSALNPRVPSPPPGKPPAEAQTESDQQAVPAQELQSPPVQPVSTQGTVKTLLAAIAANNYDRFIANAAPALKTKITKEGFTRVSTQLSPRLKKGYELQSLGSFKHQGVETFLWKITYKDGGDDMLAELDLENGRVAYFWFPPPPPPPGYTPRPPAPGSEGAYPPSPSGAYPPSPPPASQ
jgi:hypothetical protein